MARSLPILFALLLGAVFLAACGDRGRSGTTARESEATVQRPRERVPGPPWGGVIMGLRVGIDPAKKEFAPGEDLIFTVRAENVLNKPFKLPHFADGAWGLVLTIEGEDEDSKYTSRARALDDSPANDYVLQPGEVWSKRVNLSKNGGIYARGRDPVDRLPPGLYEIYGGYTNHKGEGYWVGGHCWTNGVTIRIE